jgi:RNA polymerase sigma-70 factor (ECF subfamily)
MSVRSRDSGSPLADHPGEIEVTATRPRGELDITRLLAAARRGNREGIGRLLQHYRNYLLLLATTQVERRLQSRVSPSDVVQETMLRAHRHFPQFRGQTEAELLAWLRQILLTNLARFIERYMLAAKRDIRREVSIEQLGSSLRASATHFDSPLGNRGQTPSAVAERREEAVLLADRLAQLPPQYREILVLRHIQGLSFEQAAATLKRPLGATRMLWLRAIKKLRAAYHQSEEQDA